MWGAEDRQGRNLSLPTHLPPGLGHPLQPGALESLPQAPLDPRRALDPTPPPQTPLPLRPSPPAAFVSWERSPPFQGPAGRKGGLEETAKRKAREANREEREMKMGDSRPGIRALPRARNAGSRAAVRSQLNKRRTSVPASSPARVKLAPREALGEKRHVPRGPRRGCVLPRTVLSGALRSAGTPSSAWCDHLDLIRDVWRRGPASRGVTTQPSTPTPPTPPRPAPPARPPARRKTHSKKPETKWGAALPDTSPLALGVARPHPGVPPTTPRDLSR